MRTSDPSEQLLVINFGLARYSEICTDRQPCVEKLSGGDAMCVDHARDSRMVSVSDAVMTLE